MNREAVNTALFLAGNMPLLDADKRNNNLVYDTCKRLYLPVLFTSLCSLDWRCARKEAAIRLTLRRAPGGGRYYYEMPADCVRPLYVDGNTAPFYNDRDFIVTEEPVSTLYYVFHNRNLNYTLIKPPNRTTDGMVIIRNPETEEELLAARQIDKDTYVDSEGEDFPEWEYTPYDSDLWEYFSYKLAARIIMRLRADDGAAGRSQAMEALADKAGAEAIKRSTAASTNQTPKNLYWHEQLGLSVTYEDHRKYKTWK
jgi:hypothetical protein